MENFYQQERYEQAKKQVHKLKGFYVHLLVYLVINAFILIVQYRDLYEGESIFTFGRFSTAIFWGIGLVAHGATVFIPRVIFSQKWESRKIKEIMEKDQRSWE